uniref:NADH dehydrogenase subunit 6 n=1 Tax=Notocrater youngi TaxID=2813390 RepID=A0A894JZZ9_9VEST|nr:NADH dehydrogenase subunit 6 [Notocrater youngi]
MSLGITTGLIISILFLMPLMLQPLSLGLCIMLMTMLFAILLGMTFTSWYAYILFLVFIGGLLVMFAYVSVLAPNSFFSSLKSSMSVAATTLISIPLMILITSPAPKSLTPPEMDTNMLKSLTSTGKMLVSISSTSIMISLGILLLIALLAVVKICYYHQSPLRPYNKPYK